VHGFFITVNEGKNQMKKIVAAMLLALSVAGPAVAESPFYAGAMLGPSSIGSSSSTAIGVFGGYKIPDIKLGGTGSLGIEAQFTSLGSMDYSDDFTTFGLDAIALFPLSGAPNLSLFGKIGINNISGDFRCGPYCSYSSSSGLNLGLGFGGQYKFTREFSLRFGYQYYDTNFDALYAAAVFHF